MEVTKALFIKYVYPIMLGNLFYHALMPQQCSNTECQKILGLIPET